MREILFRGRGDTKYNDCVWYYGVPIRDFEGDWQICTDNSKRVVIPETIGQYTGLTDKNGKRIFEGDMIKPFDDEIDKMVVEFRLGQFLLCLYGERGYMAEYGWEESGNYGCFEAEPLSSYGDDIEVIGNIHDSPELLRGDTIA